MTNISDFFKIPEHSQQRSTLFLWQDELGQRSEFGFKLFIGDSAPNRPPIPFEIGHPFEG
jgi:hypothetical protein